jgi:hypothetical protein
MAGVTVQQILPLGDAAFEAYHPLPVSVRQAVGALMACRTAVLGGPVPGGPYEHVQRVW